MGGYAIIVTDRTIWWDVVKFYHTNFGTNYIHFQIFELSLKFILIGYYQIQYDIGTGIFLSDANSISFSFPGSFKMRKWWVNKTRKC